MAVSPTRLAAKIHGILAADRENHLDRIEDYIHGNHDDPYMPEGNDAEYRLLVKRSVFNLCPLVVKTPVQALYVDGFRSAHTEPDPEDPASIPPEWDHWQRSRLDARQYAIHQSAVSYGHSFTVTEKNRKGEVVTRGLSPLRTAAVFEDPANDIVPYAALWVKRDPSHTEKGDPIKGEAFLWDDKHRHTLSFDGDGKFSVVKSELHGARECPVTRFAVEIDLEGRTTGVVEPLIPLQNRINQTILDLLVAQTGGAFVTRTITGMAPPVKLNPDGSVYHDPDTGRPVPLPVNLNAKRWLFGEDPEVEFGSLPATPLDGYIDSIGMSVQHFSATSQTPPHHLLGQIANLSAEALQAAEISLGRKITSFQKAFGESWERVFRLAGELEGNMDTANDVHGEVLWRDMESKSMSAQADALSKLRDLGIPDEGLWEMVPGITQGTVKRWSDLRSEQDVALRLLERAERSVRPREQQPQQPPATPEGE